MAEDLWPRIRALKTDKASASGSPRKTADVHWVRPELIAEVEMAEFTGPGMMRQASFKGLRDDLVFGPRVKHASHPQAVAMRSTQRYHGVMAYKVSGQFSFGERRVLALTSSDAIEAALHFRSEGARSVVILDSEGIARSPEGLRDHLLSGKRVNA